jgi:hypothetical protein
MSSDKPEGYPYWTVLHAQGAYAPVMVDWNPHGFEQTSDSRPHEEEYMAAKRVAVEEARRSGLPYKAPIHG